MEGNHWQNRTFFTQGRDYSERRMQHPYTARSNVNQGQGHATQYPYRNSYQSHPYGKNRNMHEDNMTWRRRNGDSNNRNFKSNHYRHRDFPYQRQEGQYSRHPTDNFVDSQSYQRGDKSSTCSVSLTDSISIPKSPQEVKTLKLIDAVRSQDGVSGVLVFMQTHGENAATIIQNTVQSIKNGVLSITPGKGPQSYELKINGEFIASGEFLNKQAAKTALCELALNKFKQTCFFIVRKRNYEEISTEDINKEQAETQSVNKLEGSKAHMMMLKMGWGGKGLGINEQGKEKTVAETMTQLVAREGLGGTSAMGKINNILKEFAMSNKVTTLAFDSGFTKEERAEIHTLAAKLNLKSKSEGSEENRRITIRKKIARWDLVKELLLADCENEAYNLTIPSNFANMWTD